MRILLATAFLALPLTPALADGSASFSNGATAEWTRDCNRGDGQATCTTNGTWTGPEGKTATKTRVRNVAPGISTLDVTTTGPQGNTRTKTRIFTWGN